MTAMPCGVATRPAGAPDPAIRHRAVGSARSVDFMRIHPLTGEFAHSADETAFLAHKLPQTRALLGFTLVFCTLFYVAFAVTDLASLGYGTTFLQLYAARMAVAATADKLSIHPNTVSYRLRKLSRSLDRDVSKFSDLVEVVTWARIIDQARAQR